MQREPSAPAAVRLAPRRARHVASGSARGPCALAALLTFSLPACDDAAAPAHSPDAGSLPSDVGAASDTPSDPVSWTFDSGRTTAFTLNAAELGAALDASFTTLWAMDVDALAAAYAELTETTVAECPQFQQFDETNGSETAIWYTDTCDASPVSYDGFGVSFYYDYGEQDGVSLFQHYVQFGGTVVAGEERISGSGQFVSAVTIEPGSGAVVWIKGVEGALSWSRADGEPTWVGKHPQSFGQIGTGEIAGVGRYATLKGGVSFAEGRVDATAADEFGVFVDVNRQFCGSDATFVISVHERDGGWFDVTFAEPTALVVGDTCRLCGSAEGGGRSIDNVCADFGPLLLGWEGAPW